MATMTNERRILDKLEEISVGLGIVQSKLPDLSSALSDHEKRLRSLEARLWYATGAVGIISIASPIVSKWLGGP